MKSILLAIIFVISISPAFSQESVCDYKAEILLDKGEFSTGEFTWRMRATKIAGVSTNITGSAEIKMDNETIKAYIPWTSYPISKQKTSSQYSPNLIEGIYKIIAEIEVECEDINKSNNVDVRIVKIQEGQGGLIKDDGVETEGITIINPKNDGSAAQEIDSEGPLPVNEAENLSGTRVIVNPQIVFESGNEKAKNLTLIFLLALSIVLNIILIWKR